MKRLTLPNRQDEIRQYRRRVIIIGVMIALLLTALIARLIYLQVWQHHYYLTLSKQNLLTVAPIDPGRGLIYDRHGVLLAGNMPVFSLEVMPNNVPDVKKTIAALSKIIQLTPADIQAFDKQRFENRRFNSVPLKVKLTDQEIAAFSVNQYRFPGVFIQAHLVRYYPFGPLMAPILGYVGRINASEFAKVDPTNYSATNYIGKTGIEKYDENLLHGTVGIQQIETGAQGNIVRSNQNRQAIAGDNLYLTIDSQLQAVAQQALQEQDYAGAVIAVDPRNGEILALVSRPSFDPNQFVTGISSEAYHALQVDPLRPLYNRALQAEFPSGSTVKPFYALEGLNSGIISPSDRIFDPGFFKLPNSTHIYHDWQRRGHGWVNVESAIIQSCDVFFYHLAQNMGIDRMDAILQRFGFGKPTGVDTYGERSGLVPSPAWKMRVRHAAWYPGDTINMGIGQGYFLITPLQLANALMQVADRGKAYQMHLLLRRELPSGTTVVTSPMPLPSLDLPAADWTLVLRALREVVSSPYGTAYRIGHDAPYTFSGKSGTAQVFSLKGNAKDKANLLPKQLRDDSWFMAMAPADQPTIILVVFLEHGGEGEATLVARHILDGYFKLMQVKQANT